MRTMNTYWQFVKIEMLQEQLAQNITIDSGIADPFKYNIDSMHFKSANFCKLELLCLR